MNVFIFLILVFLSAFFSGSETAFLSIDKIRLKQIEKMKHLSARRITSLLADPHKLLVTILIGNTFVNIAASAVLTDFFYNTMGEGGVLLSIAAMTIVILIFGEVTPKMFALSNKETVSYFVSLPLKFFEWIVAPIRIVLFSISKGIVKGIGLKVSSEKFRLTEQEIRSFFSLGKKRGIVKKKEKDMIDNILEFKESNAADIMTPRIDVAALDLTKKQEELISAIKESQKSRYPVYIHTLDNIVGIVHSKDFLLDEDVSIRNLVKKPFFAPESMKIDDLLQGLQKNHIHMAIVTDEYGVTSGIVTIEDILEEIVGEIRDEFDYETPNIMKIDKNTFEINGQTHIDDVNEQIDLTIETEEVDTIGGYVILLMGKIPRSGDEVNINGFIFTVNDVSKNRITSLTALRMK